MRWLAAVAVLFALTACRSEEAPVSDIDIDGVESTLNSIESELNQPG